MSRMKHLLRKLHLASAGTGPHQHRPGHRRSPPVVAARAQPSPSPPPLAVPVAVEVAVPIAPALAGYPKGLGVEAATTRLEEDYYQVRLPLAISASNHAGLVGVESVQIRVAERITLGADAAADTEHVEALAARYWTHSVVNYDDALADGFYNLCGAAQLHSGFQARFPSLDHLMAVPVAAGSGDVSFLAVLVNRDRDPALMRLEERAAAVAAQTRARHGGAASAELVQKIASLVLGSMGGPVEDHLRFCGCSSLCLATENSKKRYSIFRL